MDEDDRQKFDNEISAPVPGARSATGSWSREAEIAQFLKG
jgi:hypothetical protein